MEDYAGAHTCRVSDVEALATSVRHTAALHLGGIAVECRLKAMTITYHKLLGWDTPSKRLKDPLSGNPISCPGHGLMAALRLMPKVYKIAKYDPPFLKHLSRVMHPIGATNVDFISIRYSSEELAPQSFADWRRSLEFVLGWLKKNEAPLP